MVNVNSKNIVATHPVTAQILSLAPSKKNLQTGLLGLTVVGSIISLVPPLRLAGALATRSVLLFSSSLDCAKPDLDREHLMARIAAYSRVAIVALGIGGLAAASPMLIIASLAGDLALQALEMANAAKEDNVGKCLAHCSFAVIDTLALGALVLGSWPMMVAAASVSTFVLWSAMFAAMSRSIDEDSNAGTRAVFEFGCYMVLSIVSGVSAYSASQIMDKVKTNSKFTYENKSENEVVIYNKQGESVARVQPGETASFEVPYKNTLQHRSYMAVPTGNGGASIVPTFKGSYVEVYDFSDTATLNMRKLDAYTTDMITVISKPHLPVQDFPTLPIGGNVIGIL